MAIVKCIYYLKEGDFMAIQETETQVSGTVIVADTPEVAEAMARFLAEDFGRPTPIEQAEEA